MTYTIDNTVRDAVVTTAVRLIDGGSSAAGGSILFRSATTTICACLMNNPSFVTSASGGSIAMDTTGVIDGTVTPAGSSTIDRFTITNRNGVALFTGNQGSVAQSGADISLSSTTVSQNDVIEVTGLTCSLPASAGI